MVILDVLLLITVILVSAYNQMKTLHWVTLVGATLVLLTLLGHPGFILFFCWLTYLALVVLAFKPSWRKKVLTRKIMQSLQKRMPPISETEKEALESGDTWWENDLFNGSPDWNKLHTYPKPSLTSEEQAFLDNQVEKLCAMLDDWQVVRYEHDLPKKVWQYLKQEKFFGLVIPKEYGGLGFSALAHSTIVVKVATRSVSAAVNMMVPNSLGPGELLLHYGTTAQKDHYLPRLAKGEDIPCFALTGPDAGSDASSITDSGLVCYQRFQGQKTLGILLNWNKRYITLAPIATVLGLAIHLYDPEHLLSEKEDVGITLCLIPTSHPGVEVGRRHLPLYLAFMNGPTSGKDVFIPLDWIIGGPAMAGCGWRMLMECLSVGRAISLPALSAASGTLTYRLTGAYARLRKQFNLSIGHFEGVEELLSRIAGYQYILEASRQFTAGAVDQKVKPAIASAIAKYHMTELARQVVNDAMDIHAGQAIQAGPHNLLANIYLALPISITVEGANVLTRNLIIFGQGSILCHPFLLQEMSLLNSSKPEALDEFDTAFLGHVGYALRNLARAVWFAITGGHLIQVPFNNPPKEKKIIYFYKQLTVVSTNLALFTDFILLILGGQLKRRERISARLGDILSQLYMASAVLKYYQDQGQPVEDLPYVEWCIQTCLSRTQTAFKELATNFPSKWLGRILSCLIPFSKIFSRPDDRLSRQLVTPMLTPSTQRDRLTQYFYASKDPQEWVTQVEAAFRSFAQIDPIAKKFQNAIRHGKVADWLDFPQQVNAAMTAELLSKDEADALLQYEKLRQEVIKVSEFSFDLNKVVN